MPLGQVENFATVTVSTGYDASATSITLQGGEGAKLPSPVTKRQFNLVWWDDTNYTNNPEGDPNREIVRCTTRATDVLTIVRAQEGTAATTKNTGSATYKMRLVPTERFRDEIAAVIGEVYSVKDPAFGAAGDGVADDTAEIQAAIDAAEAAGGGVVYLPAGQYLISAQLLVNDHNVAIVGEGMYQTEIITNTANHTILRFNQCNYVSVRDIKVNNAIYAGANETYGIWFSECDYINVTRVYAYDCDEAGIMVAWNRTGGGFPYTYQDSSNVQITDCICTHSPEGSGVYVARASHVIIKGCYCYNNATDGIYLQGCQSSTVIGNICLDNGVTGIRAIGYSDSDPGDPVNKTLTDIAITGNTVGTTPSAADTDCTYGILLGAEAENVTISGNVIVRDDDPGTENPQGILMSNIVSGVDFGVNFVNITGNIIRGQWRYGIYNTGEAGWVNIADNVVTDFSHDSGTAYGIAIEDGGSYSVSRVYVQNNVVHPLSASHVGIRVNGTNIIVVILKNNHITGATSPYSYTGAKLVEELTIASGAVTINEDQHIIDTQSDDATDDLDTINGGYPGQRLILQSADDARNVVVKHLTGNIRLHNGADNTLDITDDKIMLYLDSLDGYWHEISFMNDWVT